MNFLCVKMVTTFYCRDVSQNSSPQNSYGGDGESLVMLPAAWFYGLRRPETF